MTRVPALRTVDVTIGYRSRRSSRAILAHLDLRVDAGEVVCLIGPNGIGKSTLLRTLAGLQRPLAGSVEVDGRDLQRIGRSELARRLAVVLTDRVAIDSLTAREVVELGRYPYSGWLGGLRPEDRRAAGWAIDAVGAQPIAARDFGMLSDGERQRIMIARALAQEPLVVVLDEPTAFLDVPSRIDVMHLLRQLAREKGLAIVLSTHELSLALQTADTIWLVTADRQLRVGPPAVFADGSGDDALESVVALLRPPRELTATRSQPTRSQAS